VIARQLKDAKAPGDRLLVVIRRSDDALLDVSARAILFAALDVVDAVMIEESEAWRNMLSRTQAVRVVEFSRHDLAVIQDMESRIVRLQAPAPVD
jgi:glycerol-3-phosphate cytidylyltransferase-like family protein